MLVTFGPAESNLCLNVLFSLFPFSLLLRLFSRCHSLYFLQFPKQLFSTLNRLFLSSSIFFHFVIQLPLTDVQNLAPIKKKKQHLSLTPRCYVTSNLSCKTAFSLNISSLLKCLSPPSQCPERGAFSAHEHVLFGILKVQSILC